MHVHRMRKWTNGSTNLSRESVVRMNETSVDEGSHLFQSDACERIQLGRVKCTIYFASIHAHGALNLFSSFHCRRSGHASENLTNSMSHHDEVCRKYAKRMFRRERRPCSVYPHMGRNPKCLPQNLGICCARRTTRKRLSRCARNGNATGTEGNHLRTPPQRHRGSLLRSLRRCTRRIRQMSFRRLHPRGRTPRGSYCHRSQGPTRRIC